MASRMPDMPTGWPSAIAPPLTLTTSSLMPRSRMEATPTAAKASLSSKRSTVADAAGPPGRGPLDRPAGWCSSDGSGPATMPKPTSSAERGETELLGLGRRW